MCAECPRRASVGQALGWCPRCQYDRAVREVRRREHHLARLLSARELWYLSASPGELIRDALEERGSAAAADHYDEIEKAFAANLRNFERWARHTTRFLLSRSPEDKRPDVTDAWRIGTRHGVTAVDLGWQQATRSSEFRRQAGTGNVQASMSLFREMERHYWTLHAAHHDWTTLLWSAVFRAGGADLLEECLRELADDTMMRWMEHDLHTDPIRRIHEWARLLRANFASVAVEEFEDRFRIVQDPCGTCTRQISDGTYDDQLGIAVVDVPHRITYGRGGLPIYRTHVAVMHWLMPIERIGVPWPVVDCPRGLDVGPCRIDLMKDPYADPGAPP